MLQYCTSDGRVNHGSAITATGLRLLIRSTPTPSQTYLPVSATRAAAVINALQGWLPEWMTDC